MFEYVYLILMKQRPRIPCSEGVFMDFLIFEVGRLLSKATFFFVYRRGAR